MKENYLKVVWVAALVISLAACGGDKKESAASKAPVAAQSAVEEVDPVLKKGETVFKSYCMACHMSKGQGVPNLNPPLTRTKYTLGDPEVMIKIVINGLDEEIEVKGQTYNNVMTPFGFLSDEEISAVISYVRQSFGNDASAVSVDEVAKVRASLAD